jgi:hypothetical protein
VLLSPLPYAHPERLVFIAGIAPGSDMKGEFGPAGEFFLQYQDEREAGRRRRHLRHLHQLAARRRAGRADPMGAPAARCTRRSGRPGARPPAAAGGRGSRVVISDTLFARGSARIRASSGAPTTSRARAGPSSA